LNKDFKKILSIIARSKLTKKDAALLAKKIKAGIAKRHGV